MNRLLAGVVLAVLLGAGCTAPDLPSESLAIKLDLASGESEIVQLEVAVSADENALFSASLDPTPATLAGDGIRTVLAHQLDGELRDGWPDPERLERGIPQATTLYATFTNDQEGPTTVELLVKVTVFTGGTPDLFEEETSISLFRVNHSG